MPHDRERLPRVELRCASPGRRVNHDLSRRQPCRERVHERLDAAAARREVVGDDQDLRHTDGYLTQMLTPKMTARDAMAGALRPYGAVEVGTVPAGEGDLLDILAGNRRIYHGAAAHIDAD